MKTFGLHALSLLVVSYTALFAASAEPIIPPFGLSLTENRARIAQLIERAHLRLGQKETAEDREVWTAEGFDQPFLSAVRFYFADDALDEVELEYGDPGWSLRQYGEFMGELKQELDRRYGRAAVLAHDRGPAKDVSQTVVGYRWQQPDLALDLVFFAAEREPLAFRLLSMHYKLAHH